MTRNTKIVLAVLVALLLFVAFVIVASLPGDEVNESGTVLLR